MAHECPECGATCHCNGDIEDSFVGWPDTVYECDHCAQSDEYTDYDNYPYDYDIDLESD